jgi:NifU-like protein involved in Fe-S cluster formation
MKHKFDVERYSKSIGLISVIASSLVLPWAIERNIIEGSTVEKQMIKLKEEMNEYVEAKNINETKDAIGDALVVIINALCIHNKSRLLNTEATTEIIYQYLFDDKLVKNIKKIGNEIDIPDEYTLTKADIDGAIEAVTNNDVARIQSVVSLLYLLAIKNNSNLMVCCTLAWDAIKDRKGKMINGIYVKEE